MSCMAVVAWRCVVSYHDSVLCVTFVMHALTYSPVSYCADVDGECSGAGGPCDARQEAVSP